MITCVLLPYTFRVSTFDPVDRDEHGAYIGVEDVRSDHARVEAAYLAAVAAFARDSGVDRLVVREPSILVINFGVEPAIDGYGLAGLFADLGDYHDGAQVPIGVAVELVRGMLRDNGAWCRLEVEDRFFVHVGYDQYVYIGSTTPCGRAAALTRDSGLFAEPVDGSPLAADFDDQPPGGRRPADTAWWAALGSLVAQRGAVLLEEGYVLNASRWHQVTTVNIDRIRAGLAPRARLIVWPDLSTEVDTVLADAVHDDLVEVVWRHPDGRITSRLIDHHNRAELPALLAGARAATAVSGLTDHRHPLLTGVLPDPDGVLRARWSAE